MRAISAVFVCFALAACDSGENKESASGEERDSATKSDSGVETVDAAVETVDAEPASEDAEVASLDAGDNELDASQAADVDGDVADTSVVDASDAEVPDATVVLTADQMLEAQVIAKFRECNVLAPTGDYKDAKVVDGFDRCVSQCYLAASCPLLLAFNCADAENTVATCLNSCYEGAKTDWFACGDGEIIAHEFMCNAYVFQQDNGPDIDLGCANGADDVGCPAVFTCSNNSTIAAAHVCDGESDCPNGADETGCAKICP